MGTPRHTLLFITHTGPSKGGLVWV